MIAMLETALIAVIAILSAAICFLLYRIYKLKYRLVGEPLVPRVDFEKDMRTDIRIGNIIGELTEKVSGMEDRLEKSEKTVQRLIKELAG